MKNIYQFICIPLLALLAIKVIHNYKDCKNPYDKETVLAIQKQITAPTDFFESNADGNWAAPASWKSSSVSSSGPWTIPATSAPSNSAQGIVIKNKITIASNESASLLVITAGGTLVHNYSKILSLSDDGSASPDMLLQNGGVYEIYGTQPLYINSSTVQIDNGGIVKAKGNSSGNSDDFARDLNVFFKTGAIMEWNTSQQFQTSNVTYFPTATINDHPIFRISASIGALGSNGNTLFNGKFEVATAFTFTFKSKGEKIFRDGLGGNGTLIHSISNTTPCGPFKITGANAIIDGNLNLQLGNNSLNANELEITSGANVTISDPNVHVGTISNSGGTFLIDGTLNISPGINIDMQYGNLILNGNIDLASAGTFSAGSSSINSINIDIGGTNGNAGVLNFKPGFHFVNNFTVNRTGNSTPRIILGSNLTANDFILTAGKIVTGNNLISWNNSGTTNKGNSASYFATCTVANATDEKGTPLNFSLPYSGNLGLRILNVNNELPIYFPVGPNLVSYNKIFLQNGSTLNNNPFTVSVAIGDIGNTPLPRVNRIWYINEANPGTSSSDMRLYFTKHTNTTGFPVSEDEVEFGFDYDDCHLIQETYVNQFIHNSNGTDIVQNAAAADLSEVFAKYTRGISYGLDGNNDGIDTFSRFSIVNAQGIILPVTIIDFNIFKFNNLVNISWKSLDEKNRLHFEIERSGDGKFFKSIGKIPAQKNAINGRKYFFTDSFPLAGKNFYRLKIYESTGQFIYSEIKKIWMEKQVPEFEIYPNPIISNSPEIQIKNHSLSRGVYNLILLNTEGKIISKIKMDINIESNVTWKINQQLIPGIYFLKIQNENFSQSMP
ncbi:MAG: T9SS type A sorting domain-containing protein, partial [Chitinophagaceae bacterium]